MKPKRDKYEREAKRMAKALKADPRYRPLPKLPAATEKTLQEVWRLWNLLPSDWPAEPRTNLLKISKRRRHRSERASLSGQRERLAQEPWDCAKDGPKPEAVSADFLEAWSKALGREHHGAIDAAAWWHEFAREDYPVAVALREQRGHAELFNRTDNGPGADKPLVAWRNGQELIAQEFYPPDTGKRGKRIPLAEFWKLEAPPLALINHARRRWQEYRKAHDRARFHLGKIKWPLNFDHLYSPADAYAVEKKFGIQVTDDCERRAAELLPLDKELLDDPTRMAEFMCVAPQAAAINGSLQAQSDADQFGGFWKLIREDQEAFLDRTHRHSQHWKSARRVAIRYSAGICFQAEFAAEMNCIFAQLPLDEKMKFIRFCDQRSRLQAKRHNQLAVLATWVQDNAPVFERFKWRVEAVMDALDEQSIDYPGSNTSGKKLAKNPSHIFRGWLHDAGIKLRFPKGRAPHLVLRPHQALLTPLPVVELAIMRTGKASGK